MAMRPTTDEQKADAARLLRYFEEWRDQNRTPRGKLRSIKSIAKTYGKSQGAFSSVLNGTMALSLEMARIFSQLLGRPVSDFSPTLAAEIAKLATGLGPPQAEARPAPAAIERKPVLRHGVPEPPLRPEDPEVKKARTSAQNQLVQMVGAMAGAIPDDEALAFAVLIASSASRGMREALVNATSQLAESKAGKK